MRLICLLYAWVLLYICTVWVYVCVCVVSINACDSCWLHISELKKYSGVKEQPTINTGRNSLPWSESFPPPFSLKRPTLFQWRFALLLVKVAIILWYIVWWYRMGNSFIYSLLECKQPFSPKLINSLKLMHTFPPLPYLAKDLASNTL